MKVLSTNKAGYTATQVACRWAGAIIEVEIPIGEEQGGHQKKKHKAGVYILESLLIFSPPLLLIFFPAMRRVAFLYL